MDTDTFYYKNKKEHPPKPGAAFQTCIRSVVYSVGLWLFFNALTLILFFAEDFLIKDSNSTKFLGLIVLLVLINVPLSIACGIGASTPYFKEKWVTWKNLGMLIACYLALALILFPFA